MRTKAIPIVIKPDDQPGCSILFSSLGDSHLCFSTEELARWALDLWRDEKVEGVDAGPQAHRLTKLLAKGVDAVRSSVGLAPQQAEAEATAVALVLQLQDAESCQGCVWTPTGQPVMFRGQVQLGETLDRLARDDKQPRVPAGPPIDPTSETLHQAGELLVDSLRGGAA